MAYVKARNPSNPEKHLKPRRGAEPKRNTPMKTQIQMFYGASRHVANEMLTKQLTELQLKRSQAMSAWRENGKTETLWEAVETIDRQIEPIEQTLLARA